MHSTLAAKAMRELNWKPGQSAELSLLGEGSSAGPICGIKLTRRGVECRARRATRAHSRVFRQTHAPGCGSERERRRRRAPGMGWATVAGPGAEHRARRLLDGNPSHGAGHRRAELAEKRLAARIGLMPAKAQWLLRVPEILAELAALDVPVVDRAVCERLFRLRRRRTIDLIRCFGGYQAGRTFLVDRPKLVAQLEQIRDSPDFKMEWRRKERLAERLDAIRRLQAGARVAIAVEPEILRQRLPDLPPGVGLSPGELHIQFQSSEELLSKLFALAQAIANDYEAFEKRTSGDRE